MCLLSATGSATPAVSVVALYRERIALPPGAVLRVALADAGASGDERQTIATVTLLNPHVPVSMSLAYEPSNIDKNHLYVVSARIALNGELWFATDTAAKVITHANPTHVELLMMRVTPGSPANIEDRRWTLSAMGGHVFTGENLPYIELRAGHLSGSGGCNRIAGGYKIEANALAFTTAASTMMMCIHEEVMQTEDAFFKALQHVRFWSVTGDRLVLLDGDHKAVMKLTAAE